MNKNITIVTGLWDMGRGELDGWAKRDFTSYKDRFFEMLESDTQMCIWIPKDLEDDVIRIRKDKPTKIFIKNLEDFETWNPFYSKIQEIRTNENWLSLAGWLRESPQASLKFYNAMMFTKMFMLNDSAIVNPFNSEYFFWIDGGLTNTVNKGYFQHDLVLDNLDNYVIKNDGKFIHLAYPYEPTTEIHGFEKNAMAKFCNVSSVNYVCRGGFFGGTKSKVHDINNLYYAVMDTTLNSGYMGADECLFTILTHRHENIIHKFDIGGNGLVWPFFEELKEYKTEIIKNDETFLNPDNTALYVITFNSPNQLQTLIDSMYAYDSNFVDKPKKFLLDNSSDLSTTEKYSEICNKYNFEHIKKDNLGICGGRQWVAEHSNENGFDYYFFFEDDMFFYPKQGEVCKNGFNRYVPDLYKKSISIINKYKFDFLKLSFSEFFGDNGTQWSWYNIPQNVRNEHFPNKPNLPVHGTDPDAPRTDFKNIRFHEGLGFIDGDVYYSNWPQVVSKVGNKKMFLTEKWDRPHEQTWMSYMFQNTRKGELNPALLLLTPTEHNRFDFYDGSLRKES
jgi:hypothetical protein